MLQRRLIAAIARAGRPAGELLDAHPEQLHETTDANIQGPRQREAVALRYLDEHKIADIATALGRSEEAVAGLLKRGVRALKAILNDRSL